MVDMNFTDITKAMHDLSTYATFAVYNYLSICSEDWLQRTNWHPITKILLPESTLPFRFAGQNAKPLFVSCIFCEVNGIYSKPFIFHHVAFVLPTTPIPFLIGLRTACTIAFNINISESNNSHLTVPKWNETFPLILQSHP